MDHQDLSLDGARSFHCQESRGSSSSSDEEQSSPKPKWEKQRYQRKQEISIGIKSPLLSPGSRPSLNTGPQVSVVMTTDKTFNANPSVEDNMNSFYYDGKCLWPHENPSVGTMARAGMCFIGKHTYKGRIYEDFVECVSCKRTMFAFTENDDPLVEHRRLHSSCPQFADGLPQ